MPDSIPSTYVGYEINSNKAFEHPDIVLTLQLRQIFEDMCDFRHLSIDDVAEVTTRELKRAQQTYGKDSSGETNTR